jgi:hypothetical protein
MAINKKTRYWAGLDDKDKVIPNYLYDIFPNALSYISSNDLSCIFSNGLWVYH